MKNYMMIAIWFSVSLIFFSCSEKAIEPEPVSGDVEVKTIFDLPADVDGDPENPVYTFFSFSDGEIVLEAEANATNWDLGFSGTTIKTNENCEVVLKQTDFNSLTQAPSDGYAVTTKINGWYSYNPETHQISTIPGIVIIIKTSNGKYTKMRVISYYKGNPAEYNEEDESRYYTFEYVYQPDGTRNF